MKALICDFDGTLAKSDKTVSEENTRAVLDLIGRGGKFAVCTGRMTCSALRVLSSFPVRPLAATYNGAEILDTETGELLFCRHIAPDDTAEIARFAEEKDINCQIYVGDQVVTPEILPITDIYCRISRNEVTALGIPVSSYASSWKMGTPKLMFLDFKDKLDRIQPEAEAVFGDRFEIARCGDFMLDFTAKGVSKGTALERLCAIWGISPGDCVCMGDEFNDLSMIQVAGVGVCMKNGNAKLKAYADYVTERTSEEDAVKEVVELFFR
ncbi:MAG: Cof-type HAD-IIB family hydrolase [Candidatus Borkfalkiaceae bacterium]|nr:Cof-type HAD-IIB family hydrolase [Christensenellaceae bacterium]